MLEVIGQPAYRQIADALRDKIAAGEYRIGTAIPSTSQLCKLYDVSVTVARAAVSELRSEGLVQGQPGKAVYVVATPQAVHAERTTVDDIKGAVDGLGKKLNQLTRRVESTPAALQRLNDDLAELRRQVALIEAHLMDLYARLGQPYPHQAPAPVDSDSRRRKARRSAGR